MGDLCSSSFEHCSNTFRKRVEFLGISISEIDWREEIRAGYAVEKVRLPAKFLGLLFLSGSAAKN